MKLAVLLAVVLLILSFIPFVQALLDLGWWLITDHRLFSWEWSYLRVLISFAWTVSCLFLASGFAGAASV